MAALGNPAYRRLDVWQALEEARRRLAATADTGRGTGRRHEPRVLPPGSDARLTARAISLGSPAPDAAAGPHRSLRSRPGTSARVPAGGRGNRCGASRAAGKGARPNPRRWRGRWRGGTRRCAASCHRCRRVRRPVEKEAPDRVASTSTSRATFPPRWLPNGGRVPWSAAMASWVGSPSGPSAQPGGMASPAAAARRMLTNAVDDDAWSMTTGSWPGRGSRAARGGARSSEG